MGSTISSLKASPAARSREQAVMASDDDDEDEDARPPKRQRRVYSEGNGITSRNGTESGLRAPFRHVTNESTRAPSRWSTKVQALKPSDFYGSSHRAAVVTQTTRRVGVVPKSIDHSIETILPKDPVNFQRAVRIDVVEIVPKHANENSPLSPTRRRKSVVDIKFRCSLALFCAKNDNDYGELLRTSKIGIIRTTFKDGKDVEREIIMPEPFVVPAEQLYINRAVKSRGTRSKSSGVDCQYTFDFADKYNVQVWLEPYGSQSEWPPMINTMLTDSNSSPAGCHLDASSVTDVLNERNETWNDLQLCAITNANVALLDPDRQTRAADLKLYYGPMRQKLSYALKLEIQWSLPSHLSDIESRLRKVEAAPTLVASTISINESVPVSPGEAKREDVSAPTSPADSRAQRRRSNVPTYNLKTLSAQAQGRSPRVYKSREPISMSSARLSEQPDGLTVTYTFGRADSADLGVKQQTVIAGLMCPFCNYDYDSMNGLRFHLHTHHSSFKFHVRRSNPPRMAFYVELAKQGRTSPATRSERARTIQMCKPVTLFDLEKFLSGDQSWAKAREGPQHNLWPDHLIDRAHESSLSSSPHESRHSSPNTSNDTDDVMDLETFETKLPVRTRKVFYVPKTSKPLYDAVTKRILQPGEEIPSSDDEKDEGWLHQKHRDVILDFTDVTNDEKDYIIRWNPFIMGEQLTNETYLPNSILRFVEINKAWFAKRGSRKREFGKQMETFLLRGVVTQDCFHKCIMILRKAEKMEARKGAGETGKECEFEKEAAWHTQHRGILDCVCGEHTQPPNRVVCRGRKCPGRFFHSTCAEKSGRSIAGQWKCDACFGLES